VDKRKMNIGLRVELFGGNGRKKNSAVGWQKKSEKSGAEKSGLILIATKNPNIHRRHQFRCRCSPTKCAQSMPGSSHPPAAEEWMLFLHIAFSSPIPTFNKAPNVGWWIMERGDLYVPIVVLFQPIMVDGFEFYYSKNRIWNVGNGTSQEGISVV
jgi:hypothetical protein